MKITILATTNPSNPMINKPDQLVHGLELSNHQVTLFPIDQMKIFSCTGCWGCWVKTPGKCVIKDDMDKILDSMINSDLVIFHTPLIMGYVPGKLKIAMDRTIPLVHPYIIIVQKECHHKQRYKKYPKFGIILSTVQSIEREEKEIVQKLFERYSLNFKSTLEIFAEDSGQTKEIINEINNI